MNTYYHKAGSAHQVRTTAQNHDMHKELNYYLTSRESKQIDKECFHSAIRPGATESFACKSSPNLLNQAPPNRAEEGTPACRHGCRVMFDTKSIILSSSKKATPMGKSWFTLSIGSVTDACRNQTTNINQSACHIARSRTSHVWQLALLTASLHCRPSHKRVHLSNVGYPRMV